MSPHANVFATGARKLFVFPDRVAAFLKGRPIRPVTVEIQPTERCNHRCPDCQARFTLPLAEVRDRGRRGVDLDLELLDELWHAPPEGVVLSGNTGDPLLHSRIKDLLTTLARRAIPTVVITNGEAIDDEIAEALVAACIGVRVSLDAGDAETHRRTHGTRAVQWDAVLCGIERLVRARDRVPPGRRPTVGAGYLTSADTITGMVAATRICRALGLDYIQFRPFHGSNADPTEEMEICRTIEDPPRFVVLSSEQKYKILRRPDRTYASCHGASFFTVIDARGDVYLCCHHVGRLEARVANLRDVSWPALIERSMLRTTAASFPLSSCVPHCRLHTHNEALEHVLRGGRHPEDPLPTAVAAHAAFL